MIANIGIQRINSDCAVKMWRDLPGRSKYRKTEG
jgi:hypothetical protein